MKILTYAIILLGALGAVAHNLLVDPASATILTPKVQATLGLVGVVIAALLPALQAELAKLKDGGK